MTRRSCVIWTLLVGLFFSCAKQEEEHLNSPNCMKESNLCHYIVADNFYGNITAQNYCNMSSISCIVFMPVNAAINQNLSKYWPQMQERNGSKFLYISKWHVDKDFCIYVLLGKCSNTVNNPGRSCNFSAEFPATCHVRCLKTKTMCKHSNYDENFCSSIDQQIKDKYIFNITAEEKQCRNCNNPVKIPEKEIILNSTVSSSGGAIDPVEAVNVMNGMAKLASSLTEPAAALSGGEGVTGIIVRETEPLDVQEVSFAYTSPNESLSIIDDREALNQFSRSVTVSKEAFKKAVSSNVSVPFAAVFRFLNMAKDELNSTVLGDEILAVEMGASITNLTDTININFWNMKYKGIPTCHSWNGEGSRPNWTDSGCLTVKNGSNITCRCSHLTFFAILLTPLNETISSSDLSNLTIITQVGCGLSMFFLSVVLFMHFLLRKTKPTKTTRILIHLVSAMFLLNLTFLINNFVAKLNNSVGCKIMAALMHYFMLTTFTWFAVQAFHLCLQLYTGGKIVIHRYMLKLSIISWVTPSIVGIVLLIIGKYGEQFIHTDNTAEDVAMCWITDNDVHYIVNIGYYALVFLFTLASFIIVLSWLICLKRTKDSTTQANGNGRNIVTIFGLCCMLGITWGFAFFAYGVLLIPSYYIFTILNSFQGFFLFIYYYSSSHTRETNAAVRDSDGTTSISTLKTSLDICENPYINLPAKR
ncbi:adhesion G-protein coupled receptor G5-like [Toxotes jaculatrix]|uniref:adhesion G-protein coupled receptor G5-like n=1 Tax=Toxotes jaculatrix TaxID=941984 RepID=UPI001B3A9CA4|nr:adhesion G-protein coupled receptor G5-like [Toxotes jaculatrix]XP_040919685.1 adhesion G-protein coupled receptor G5-like [Toxotes jaculatrix]